MMLLAFLTWNKPTRYLAAIIIPILCLAVYKSYDAIDELKGKPTQILPEGKWLLLASFQDPPNKIYLLVQLLDQDEPIYIVIPWKKEEGTDVAGSEERMKEGVPRMGEFKKGNGTKKEYDKLEMYDFNIQEIMKKSP